jgi:hypothetical protein
VLPHRSGSKLSEDTPAPERKTLDAKKLLAQFSPDTGAKLVGVELATTIDAKDRTEINSDVVTVCEQIKSRSFAVAVIDPSSAERTMGRMLGSVYRYRSQLVLA